MAQKRLDGKIWYFGPKPAANTPQFRYAILETMGHARVVWWACVGKISHTNLKIRMVISGIATSKIHIELLVRGQMCNWICAPRQILV